MDAHRPLPNIGAPATRALAEAGIADLRDVQNAGLDYLSTLHGVGPKAVRLLQSALDEGAEAERE
ncbi:helix-hairpin-helix domain-containing protein [Herbiconiux solani]|uniref:helix-hairpin-helix domain-containing protein n=1 Tax=Herbiconiux solani TaxID=661329 RepID=UPI000A05DE8B